MSGFNEIILFFLLIILGLLTLFYIKHKQYKLFFLSLLIAQIGCVLVVVLAPGNSNRQAHFENAGQFSHSFYYSCLYTARFIFEWIFNPAFWLFPIFLFSYFKNKGKKYYNKLFSSVLAIPLLIIGPVFIACFAPIWATGILGQHRTPNLAYWIILFNIFMIVRCNWHQMKSFRIIKKVVQYSPRTLFVIFILSLALWKNGSNAIYDLVSGNAAGFNTDLYNRYHLLSKCAQDTGNVAPCVIPFLEHKPNTLLVYDIVEDYNHWFNTSYACFFGNSKVNRVVTPKK